MLKIVGRITTSKIDYRANFQQRSSLTTFTIWMCSLLDIVYETFTFFQITGSDDVIFINN